jgi:uncharacterized protein YbjT (DUF2867 family)
MTLTRSEQTKTILVTGATGQQGGSTLRHLAERGGFTLRAMTRRPEGHAAQALRSLGAEVVAGDLEDADSLARAVRGAWAVFGVQNTWEAGVNGEERQGRRLLEMARAAGVEHFVYSSVGSANRHTGIPHFESKARVEDALRNAGFASYAIVRPVFFMENLLGPEYLCGDELVGTLGANDRLQMIASDDIGRFAAAALADATRWNHAEVDIAGDALTLSEVAVALTRAMSRPIRYIQRSPAAARAPNDDVEAMLAWFKATGFSADIASLEARWGVRPRRFVEWLGTTARTEPLRSER